MEKDIQIVNNHMKRCSISLTIRGMQITITSYHYKLIEITTTTTKQYHHQILTRKWKNWIINTLLLGM